MVTSNLWGRYTNAKGIGNVRSNIAIYKGRSIRLDIHAILGDGTEFDVEVQRSEEGAHIRRICHMG